MKGKGRITAALSYGFVLLLAFSVGVMVSVSADLMLKGAPTDEPLKYLSSSFFAFLLCALYSIAALIIHVPVHELGHLVFGLLSGYRFSSFRLGGVMLKRNDSGFRLCRYKLPGTAGQCIMIPPRANDAKMPTTLYNIGGGVANLAVSGALLALGFLLREHSAFFAFTTVFFSVGLYMALSNLVPMRISGVANDGYNAYTLSRSESARRALSVQLYAEAESGRGVRLSDMPDEWFYRSCDRELSNIHVAAHAYLLAQRMLDRELLSEAYGRMRELLERADLLPIYEGLLRCDMAFCEAVLGGDRLKIEGILTPLARKTMKSMSRFPSVIRTEYALAVLDGDKARAEALLARFENAARLYPNLGEIAAEERLISLINEKIQ